LLELTLLPSSRPRREGKEGSFARNDLGDYIQKYEAEIDSSEDGHPRAEDIAYIHQFPIYNYDVTDWSEIGLWRNREYKTYFGPFAS